MPDEPNLARSEILTSALGEDAPEWIPVAAADQKTVLTLASGQITLNIAEEALKENLDSWIGGYINVNHMNGAEVEKFKIEGAKYLDGILYHKVSAKAASFIQHEATSGRSIEVQVLKIVDNKVVSYKGLGLSVLFPPYKPACGPEMGCSALPKEDGTKREIIHKVFSALAEKTKSRSSNNNEGSGTGSDQDSIEAEKMTAEEIIKLTSALAEAKGSQVEQDKELVTLKSSLAEQALVVTDQTAQLKEMTDRLKVYDDAKLAADAALVEDQWTMLKATIPPGKTHTPELEAALKAEYIANPGAFAIKVVSFLAEKEDPRGESGSAYTPGSNVSKDEAADFKLLEQLGM